MIFFLFFGGYFNLFIKLIKYELKEVSAILFSDYVLYGLNAYIILFILEFWEMDLIFIMVIICFLNILLKLKKKYKLIFINFIMEDFVEINIFRYLF